MERDEKERKLLKIIHTGRELKGVRLYKGNRPGDGESKKFCKERKKNCWFICKMREYVTSKNRLNVNITRRKNI